MRIRLFLPFLALLLPFKASSSQTPTLLKDINTRRITLSSEPYGFVGGFASMGGYLYFGATTSDTGVELFRTDLKHGKAELVKDINPGSKSSYPSNFMVVGNTLFFIAYDKQHGRELWGSDGTSSGTRIIKDIYPGTGNSYPQYFCPYKGKLYFSADSPKVGRELWVSDGTTAGTTLVADIIPGSGSGEPKYITVFNGALFFQAYSPATGVELWTSRGTGATTKLFLDIYPGRGNSTPHGPRHLSRGTRYGFYVLGKEMFFLADDGRHGSELWKTDGTKNGTTMVKDIQGGSQGTSINYMTNVGNTLFFDAYTSPTGSELWKSDGTAAGTNLVRDIWQGFRSSAISHLMAVGNRVIFFADAGYYSPPSLYVSDGTFSGTKVLKQGVYSSISEPYYKYKGVALGGKVVFPARDNSHGSELWISDGTDAGTGILKEFNPGHMDSNPHSLTKVGSLVFYSGRVPGYGQEICVTDGTEKGTKLFSNVYPEGPTYGSYPKEFTPSCGRFFFLADDGVHGSELWVSDGTTPGTRMVLDGTPGKKSTYIRDLTPLGSRLFFFSYSQPAGMEPWISDGSAAGTMLLKDIMPGSSSSSPRDPFSLGDRVLFMAKDSGGWGLWVTDGTPGGTRKLTNGTRVLQCPVKLGDLVLFQGLDQAHGKEIWRTDGTPSGTYHLKDILPGPGWGGFINPIVLGDCVLFEAQDQSGTGIWRTDGSKEGTVKIRPGVGFKSPVSIGDRVVFHGQESFYGDEPWITDGTTRGTHIIADLSLGPAGSLTSSSEFCGISGRAFFTAFSGKDLYVTDGTAKGTQPLNYKGWTTRFTKPQKLFPGGTSRVFFTAQDTPHGRELWVSDGTPSGTKMVCDLNPGPKSTYFTSMILTGGCLFFPAGESMYGFEPWKLIPGPTAQVVGFSKGTKARLFGQDPFFGGTSTLEIFPLAKAPGGILIFAAPWPCASLLGAPTYFNLSLMYLALPFRVDKRKRASIPLQVPRDPALTGAQVMCQAFLPSLPRGALPATNGLLLTFFP